MSNSADHQSQAAVEEKGSLHSTAAPVDNVDIGFPAGFLWVDEGTNDIYVSVGNGTWLSNGT